MHTALLLLAVLGQVAPTQPPSTLPSDSARAVQAKPVEQNLPASEPGDASSPPADKPPHRPRVIFLTAKDSPRCAEELQRLSRPGGDFERLRSRGWRIGPEANSHLQIVDKESIPDLVARLNPREFPTVACIDGDEIVRSFQSGCTTPLDMWTFGWLAKGIDERPPGMPTEAARAETTGHYPLRGNHWSVDGDWSPARETVVAHLRGPNHAQYMQASWQIESWSYEEVRSLHDDLHERYGGSVSASRQSSSSRNTNQFSAGRKINGR